MNTQETLNALVKALETKMMAEGDVIRPGSYEAITAYALTVIARSMTR